MLEKGSSLSTQTQCKALHNMMHGEVEVRKNPASFNLQNVLLSTVTCATDLAVSNIKSSENMPSP